MKHLLLFTEWILVFRRVSMPKGHFDIKLLDSRDLTDEDFHRAQKDGSIDDLLDNLEVKEHYSNSNQITHLVPGWLYYHAFGISPGIGETAASGNLFHYVMLCTDTEEPTYDMSEWNPDLYVWAIRPLGDVADAEIKRPASAIRGHQLTVEPNSTGRRSITDVHKYLWTPNQCVSNEIRTVKICSTNEGSDYWYYYDEINLMTQFRIKDSNGNPQTIAKTANEVLLIQWTLTMKSI